MEAEDIKQNRISIFKYNVLLSALFFISSSFYLAVQTKDFSLTNYTFSELAYFLDNTRLTFFNSIFFVKALLDLSFTLYVFRFFGSRLNILSKSIWLIAVLSFGLIGLFPTNQYEIAHTLLAYIMFLSWTASEYIFARVTESKEFIYLTNNLILIQILFVILFFALNSVNAIFETIYFMIVFVWLFNFISRYLK